MASGAFDAKRIEEEVKQHWSTAQVPQNLAKHREGAKKFFLLDGPPYINAQPHVGHVKTTVFKDVWTKLRYMQGFNSYIQPGFDTHGLPVEVIVEKELGIQSKKQIEQLGIANFIAKCTEKVANNEKSWLEYYTSIGAWRAYFTPYFTYKDYYIESAWWTFKQMHEKGMVVEGQYPIHWCSHCETALSGYEVSDSYKDMQDPSVYVKFPLKQTNAFLIVWTTTPWTLCANVAVAVNPREPYVRVRVNVNNREEEYILAEARLQAVLGELMGMHYEVLEKFPGEQLVGMEYAPVLDVEQQRELPDGTRRVFASIPIMKHKTYKKHKMSHDENAPEKENFDEFVGVADGSGLVHVAPGHGSTDYFFGQHYGLPAVSPVDEQGKLTEKASQFSGMFVKSADKEILAWLESEGRLLFAGKLTHSYPLCWRCKTPLIFRLSKQWYVSIDSIKGAMVENNEKVHWMPPHGRDMFRNWLANSTDWCVSQQRYWGIPLPIWACGQCGSRRVIGGVQELRESALDPFDEKDLHKHVVDNVRIQCECGGAMRRVPDIFTVWFDSGIAPWASLGYPYRNKELFEKLFPVDIVTESQDQIRGWFYTLFFCSHAAFGRAPFENVGLMGWVLDEKGEKMSKSLGNVVPAQDAIAKLGADALRLYYCLEVAPWEVQKFSYQSASESQRVVNILWNSYAFFETYAANAPSAQDFSSVHPLDAWILSRLHTTGKTMSDAFENFEFQRAGRAFADFISNDFSRWYIKLSRDRVSGDDARDRAQCLHVMKHVLIESCKLSAPMMPFISEFIYRKLSQEKESVHYCMYPEAKASLEQLEKSMGVAQAIVEASNAARAEAKVKLRWPLRSIVVQGDAPVRDAVRSLANVIAVAANVKGVEYFDAPPGEGTASQLVKKDFVGGSVYLDPILDEALLREALYREVVRAVQAERKNRNLVVSQRIALTLDADDALVRYFDSLRDALCKEVGASALSFGSVAEGVKVQMEGTVVSFSFAIQ